MSLDRRLRQELRRDAEVIDPDVERHLGAVEARARRRGGVSPSMLLVAAAIILAAVILRLPERPAVGTGGEPSASASPSASVPASYPEIAGTYRATLDGSDAAVSRHGLGGTWIMQLEADGAVVLTPPAGFLAGASGLSGIAFALTGDRFRTNLFYNDYCNSIGNYVWSDASGHLAFTSVDDTCAIRQTLLTTMPWSPVR